jgi:hypothetical protein
MSWTGLKKLNAKIRQLMPHYSVKQQRIRCPQHDCEAIVAARVRLQTRRRARYIDVETCSLFANQPAALDAQIVGIPDLPDPALALGRGESLPRYVIGIPCQQTCLPLLNGDLDAKPSRQRGFMMGMYDCLEVERDVDHKTDAESTPLRSPQSFCA